MPSCDRSPLFVLMIVIISLAAAAPAHELLGPTIVDADASGHFAYEITLIIDSPIEFDFYELDGTDNTDVGFIIADGFCYFIIEPGTYTTPVEGNLEDPTVAGSVWYEHHMCDGWSGTLSTVIVPQSVSTESRSWSAVKGLYR